MPGCSEKVAQALRGGISVIFAVRAAPFLVGGADIARPIAHFGVGMRPIFMGGPGAALAVKIISR